MPDTSHASAASILLYYFDEEYRSRHATHLEAKSWRQLWPALRIAEENGLYGSFCRKLAADGILTELPAAILGKIKNEEKKRMSVADTLRIVASLLREESLDFMPIKLYRGVDYVPRDIDLLAKAEQVPHLLSALRRNGFLIRSFKGVENECLRDDLMKVDLYQGFHYLSLTFMDDSFLWDCQRNVNLFGTECLIPCATADFVSLAIHALLGHRCLSFLDFLYADSLLRNTPGLMDDALLQTEKHNWTRAFLTFISMIKMTRRRLDSASCQTDFPAQFQPGFLLEAFEGFAESSLGQREKLSFIASTLMDNALHGYLILQRKTGLELGDSTKRNILKAMHSVRHLAGDWKLRV